MILSYPAKIVCEWNGLSKLPEILEELSLTTERLVLVTGQSPRYDEIKDALEDLLQVKVLGHYNKVPPEPALADVQALTDYLRERPARLVIAIGGGSVIDTGKAAAIIANAEGSAADYFFGHRTFENPGVPFIAVPTTAGTGAEITRNSVIIDEKSKVKQSIRHLLMVPLAAICDAKLTLTMPREVTVASGLDALTQAIEAFLSKRANNTTRALSLQAVRLIMENLTGAVERPMDPQARSAMCEASLMTAMAFASSGLGAVHGLAHPIGALLKIPHGQCCAIILPHVLAFNAPVCNRRLTELAATTGYYSPEAWLEAVQQLCSRLDIPANIPGLTPEHFPFILENCRSNSMNCNPVHLEDGDILQILQSLTSAE